MTGHQQKELGRTLRLIRHARELTLRDVAKRAGKSYQYVQNLESGTRGSTMADDDAFAAWIATGYEISADQARALLARAQIMSAIETLGIVNTGLLWAGIEGLLRGAGADMHLTLDELVRVPKESVRA